MYINEKLFPFMRPISRRITLATKFKMKEDRHASENFQIMNYGMGGRIGNIHLLLKSAVCLHCTAVCIFALQKLISILWVRNMIQPPQKKMFMEVQESPHLCFTSVTFQPADTRFFPKREFMSNQKLDPHYIGSTLVLK